MTTNMKRREFITLLGGAAAWPVAARAQRQPEMPVIGFIESGAADEDRARAFRVGLGRAGYVDGQNVTIEYHWLEGQLDQLSALISDLVRRRAAGLVALGNPQIAIAAKTATDAIPIVFSIGDDPVKLGLVASLNRPGGNVTGFNFFNTEVMAKRLSLLHDLLPKAIDIAVLVSRTTNAASELHLVQEAAGRLGLRIRVLNASTSQEIDDAFATLTRERPDALFVAPNSYFTSRRVQLAILAARDRIPASYASREIVAAGGLMSYGTDIKDGYRQAGAYIGSILKGAKPADLPVQQATKFELVINLATAKALGIQIPPTLLAITDEVIE
jgi:putative tryptophan/tyrosine transport system substrate-binding protein